MAMNTSGPISLGGATTGQSINLEIGSPATSTVSLNDTIVRTLAGVVAGQIVVPTDFYGKSLSSSYVQVLTYPSAVQSDVFPITVDSSGNQYIYLMDYNVGNPSIYLVKLDSSANLTWAYKYSVPSRQLYASGNVYLHSNGYIYTGAATQNSGATPTPSTKPCILKFDTSGNFQSSVLANSTTPSPLGTQGGSILDVTQGKISSNVYGVGPSSFGNSGPSPSVYESRMGILSADENLNYINYIRAEFRGGSNGAILTSPSGNVMGMGDPVILPNPTNSNSSSYIITNSSGVFQSAAHNKYPSPISASSLDVATQVAIGNNIYTSQNSRTTPATPYNYTRRIMKFNDSGSVVSTYTWSPNSSYSSLNLYIKGLNSQSKIIGYAGNPTFTNATFFTIDESNGNNTVAATISSSSGNMRILGGYCINETLYLLMCISATGVSASTKMILIKTPDTLNQLTTGFNVTVDGINIQAASATALGSASPAPGYTTTPVGQNTAAAYAGQTVGSFPSTSVSITSVKQNT